MLGGSSSIVGFTLILNSPRSANLRASSAARASHLDPHRVPTVLAYDTLPGPHGRDNVVSVVAGGLLDPRYLLLVRDYRHVRVATVPIYHDGSNFLGGADAVA